MRALVLRKQPHLVLQALRGTGWWGPSCRAAAFRRLIFCLQTAELCMSQTVRARLPRCVQDGCTTIRSTMQWMARAIRAQACQVALCSHLAEDAHAPDWQRRSQPRAHGPEGPQRAHKRRLWLLRLELAGRAPPMCGARARVLQHHCMSAAAALSTPVLQQALTQLHSGPAVHYQQHRRVLQALLGRPTSGAEAHCLFSRWCLLSDPNTA